MRDYSIIGTSIPRVDSREKVTGEALYTSDLQLPGMLYGKILRSPHAFARIRSLSVDRARQVSGVRAVITAKDTVQHAYGPIAADELALADEYVRYDGEGIAAIAAVDEDSAEEALDLIEIDYEVLSPVLDAEKAMGAGAPAVHPERKEVKNNIGVRLEFERGEGESAFQKADLIVEDRFSTQLQYHAYMEPQSCVARWESSGKLTVWVSTQSPFRTRNLLAKALGILEHQIRIIHSYVGGGFGGKIYLQPHLPIAALLAQKTGKPVKIVYTRSEDFIASRPRVAEHIDLRMGFKKDGTMVAKSVVVTADAGAYLGASPRIVQVSITRPDCLYRLPNIKAVANIVYTNKIPRSPFRGFGNPEMLFATESLIDIAAEKLHIDPTEIRLKNCVQKDDVTVHGWMLNSCGLEESIKLAAEKSDWKTRRRKKTEKRGIGIACQVHPAGNRASVKDYGYDGSSALINIDQHGKVKVISGESELGQGMLTIFAQIAAEEIGVKIDDVEVVPFVDSDISPFGFGTFGDRVTVVGGNAILMAAKDAKQKLLAHAAEKLGVPAKELDIKNGELQNRHNQENPIPLEVITKEIILKKLGGAPITGRGEYTVPDYVVEPDKNGYGNYSLSYTFSTAIPEVSVDLETGHVKILNIWYAINIGKMLNPKLCEGQIDGGVVQGIGYTLNETYLWDDRGRILNPNFKTYYAPTSVDTPKIHYLWLEQPNPGSPFGAKGVGEPVINPIAPAVANAIYNAVGIRIKDLPITPEKVLKALKEKTVNRT